MPPNAAPAPISDALHVVIDMQRLFAEPTVWQVAGCPALVPAIARLLRHAPGAAAFARFIPPRSPEAAPGMWQGYYRHWSDVTTERLPEGMLDILAPLAARAPAAPVLDKAGYSLFSGPAFRPLLAARGTTTLILSGIETDVCVLSTVMEAIDAGLRVIIATDAVASSSEQGHAAALAILRSRFDLQVELLPVAAIRAAWAQQ